MSCEKYLFNTHFDNIEDVQQSEMVNISNFMKAEEQRRESDDDIEPRFFVKRLEQEDYNYLVSLILFFTKYLLTELLFLTPHLFFYLI